MADETVIVVPVLGRPWAVRPFLASLEKATPEPHSVLFIATVGDTAELDALRAAGAGHLVVPVEHEGYARKLNLGIAHTDAPYIFQAADDLAFHPGWLKQTRDLMEADPMLGVVGTNDLFNPRVLAGAHSTHSLLRRSYVEREGLADGTTGKALHEGYRHAYCDDELVETAKFRGAFAPCLTSIVEHLHPYARKSSMDQTYTLGMSFIGQDHAEFETRAPLWGGTRSHVAS